MTHQTTDPETVALVRDVRGDEARRIGERLRAEGRSVQWHVLRDVDLVDRDVREGRVREIIVGHCSILLEGIWNGAVSFGEWRRAGVRLEFLESPGEDTATVLATVADAWVRYSQDRRRRQLIAGLLLSLIAALAAFVIVGLGR